MNSAGIALVVLAVVFAGALFGMFVGQRLVPHHITSDTNRVITAAMAVVGTMTALVIGLLISSANTTYVTRSAATVQVSVDVIRLDGLLRRYGPETADARAALHAYAEHKLENLFGASDGSPRRLEDPAGLDRLFDVQYALLALKPGNDRQRWLLQQAQQRTDNLSDARWQIAMQDVSSVPLPYLGVVALWLAMLFASFGLFSPRNATAVVTLFVCALAVSSAFKLMLDMDTPFGGPVHTTGFPIRLSPEPLRHALQALER
jgi:hypothetical protein